jgi:hypothetical protein
MENRLYELSRIELPIYDGNTKVEHGFTIRLPFEVLKQYYPAPAIKI